jgi:hypothetical protein
MQWRLVGGNQTRMPYVQVQCGDQCRPILVDMNSRVAMTVNSPLVALGENCFAESSQTLPSVSGQAARTGRTTTPTFERDYAVVV